MTDRELRIAARFVTLVNCGVEPDEMSEAGILRKFDELQGEVYRETNEDIVHTEYVESMRDLRNGDETAHRWWREAKEEMGA